MTWYYHRWKKICKGFEVFLLFESFLFTTMEILFGNVLFFYSRLFLPWSSFRHKVISKESQLAYYAQGSVRVSGLVHSGKCEKEGAQRVHSGIIISEIGARFSWTSCAPVMIALRLAALRSERNWATLDQWYDSGRGKSDCWLLS